MVFGLCLLHERMIICDLIIGLRFAHIASKYDIHFVIYDVDSKKRLEFFESYIKYDLIVDVTKKDQSFFHANNTTQTLVVGDHGIPLQQRAFDGQLTSFESF